MLRSCYSTTMRFPGIGDVPIRWYFTDAEFLHTPNVYNSRNWLSDKEQEYPWGEVKGAARVWVNGRPPPGIDCTVPKGDSAAWAGAKPGKLYPCKGIGVFYRALLFQERSWSSLVQWTGRYLPAWRQERSWSSSVTTTAHYAATWSQERYWHAPESFDDHKSATWSQERSWSAVQETTDHFSPFWSQERSWSAVLETLGSFLATWSQERSWSAVMSTPVAFSVFWDHERRWGATEGTHDNMTSFSQGTPAGAGTTQGTATAISADFNLATSSAGNTGLILPNGPNLAVVFNNNTLGGSNINLYPPSGGTLGALPTNTPLIVSPGNGVIAMGITNTVWHYVSLTA